MRAIKNFVVVLISIFVINCQFTPADNTVTIQRGIS